MMKLMLFCCCCLIGMVCGGRAGEGPAWEVQPGTSATLRLGEQVLLTLHAGEGLTKPYLDPVAVPGGPNLAWTQPPDHPWHYGLWFSWKYINGRNYWEENRETGRAQGQTTWDGFTIKTGVDGSAKIMMELAYRPTLEAAALLTEQRSIAVDPVTGDTLALDWTSVFTAGSEPVTLERTGLPGEPGGKAWGGYAGLSMRMHNLANRQLILLEGPQSLADGRYRGPSAASDFNGVLEGREVGYAVLDHPDNPRHPTPWYAIADKVMSYQNAAVLCFKGLKLEPGETFTLRYRILVHPGRWTPGELKKAVAAYTAGR